MVDNQRNIASFMIRFTQHIWHDKDDDPQVQWRGQINHVQGDDEATFTDLTEALEFIQRHLTQLTLDATAGGDKNEQDEVLTKSYILWEQFAGAYSSMMVDAMQRSINQSEAFKDQMDETVGIALKSWKFPSDEDSDEIDTAIKELNSQVQVLAEKIARLEEGLNKG
jgi:hypothetical protein